MSGFEPLTFRPPDERATKLRHTPLDQRSALAFDRLERRVDRSVQRDLNPQLPACKADTLPLSYAPKN